MSAKTPGYQGGPKLVKFQVWLAEQIADHLVTLYFLVTAIVVLICAGLAILVAVNVSVGRIVVFSFMALLFLGATALFIELRKYGLAIGWVLVCAAIGQYAAIANTPLFIVLLIAGVLAMVVLN